MFSTRQKREIADKIQKILRETNHPELPEGEIEFAIRVEGAQNWSWAFIKNNAAEPNPDANPHNEAMDVSKVYANDVKVAMEKNDGN
jgi:hypothetical protein